MTNTYPDDAPHDVKLLEEIRCLRCVNERILRVMDEGLFVDYQMEKFSGSAESRRNVNVPLQPANNPINPGSGWIQGCLTNIPPLYNPCRDCQQMKDLMKQHPNGYVGDTPCAFCPHGQRTTSVGPTPQDGQANQQ